MTWRGLWRVSDLGGSRSTGRVGLTGCVCSCAFMSLSQETEQHEKGGQSAAEAHASVQRAANDPAQKGVLTTAINTEVPYCAFCRSRVNHHHKATILSGTSAGPTCSGSPLARVGVKAQQDAIEASCGSTRSTQGSFQKDVERFNKSTGASSTAPTDSHPVQLVEPHHRLLASINVDLSPSAAGFISRHRIAALFLSKSRFVLSSLTPSLH